MNQSMNLNGSCDEICSTGYIILFSNTPEVHTPEVCAQSSGYAGSSLRYAGSFKNPTFFQNQTIFSRGGIRRKFIRRKLALEAQDTPAHAGTSGGLKPE